MSKAPKNYIHWVFTDHYFKNGRGVLKLIGTIYGIIQVIYVPSAVMDEYYQGYIPLFPVILMYLTIWGFLLGITLQPYSIYRRLKRIGWWDREKKF